MNHEDLNEKDLNHGTHGMHGREDLNKLLFEEETYAIRGAVFEVYKEMGAGFLEAVYQECLEMEFTARRIPHVAQARLGLTYKGEPLDHHFFPDFICFQKIIIEVKAVQELLPLHEAQVFNYLKASGMKLGLLVNFGHHPKVEIRRFVL